MGNLHESPLSLHSHPEKKVAAPTNVTGKVMALHYKTEEHQKDQETYQLILCIYRKLGMQLHGKGSVYDD
jgi:hypothetical protein